jgi:hypothetical protein
METSINGDDWQPIAGAAKDTMIRFPPFARHEAMKENLLTHEHAGDFKEL